MRNVSRGVGLAALVLLPLSAPAHGQVHVDIGIRLPAPPQLVVVAEVPAVQYVPTVAANLFVYGGQYWAFLNGVWHVSATHAGPWVVVSPQVVPRPILLVPVAYYKAPPGHWKAWQRREPPRWSDDWGPEWAEKRGWKGGGSARAGGPPGRDRGPAAGPGRGKGQGRGPDR